MMGSSGSGGSGAGFIKLFGGRLAFDLEALEISVGRPTLEDRKPFQVLGGSGVSVWSPNFNPASGDFKVDSELFSGGSLLRTPLYSGVKRLPALRAALTG
jgi:hypothetical protein